MRLLIDSVTIGSPGGIQLRNELTRSIEESAPKGSDVVLLASPGSCEITNSDRLHIVTMDKPKSTWTCRWNWYNNILPQTARKYAADVVYSLSSILSKKLWRSFGVVSTVNNMIPFTQEILRTYPLISKDRLRYAVLRRALVASLRTADAVVLHSKHALDMITQYTGDISSKSLVVLTGVPRDLNFDRSAPPPHPYGGAPYFLYFSALYPYKNHLKLIEAYHRALDIEGQLPDLLIAGVAADKSALDKVLAAIKENKLEKKVKYIGALERKDIAAWLYHADINFFPSTCETNSVVLAEILGLGGVLACSNKSSIPEVAGYAAEFFDPYLVDSIKDVIINLFHNRKRCDELRCLALKRAKELSWDECGKAIWQAAVKAKAAFLNRKEA